MLPRVATNVAFDAALIAATWRPLPEWLAALAGLLTLLALAAGWLGPFARRWFRAAGLLGVLFIAWDSFFRLLAVAAPRVEVHFDPMWPWPAAALATVALFAVVLVTYPPRIAHLPPGSRRLLLGARLAAAAVLAFALWRPAAQWPEKSDKRSVFLLAADTSRSMSTNDVNGGRSRYAAMTAAFDANADLLAELAKTVEVRRYQFDRETRSLPWGEAWPSAPAGDQTALGAMLDFLRKDNANRRIVGILVASDFAQRAVPPDDADPRIVAQQLGAQQIQIYTVPFGSPQLSRTATDAIAEDLQVSPTVFVKNRVVVGAKVRALGLAGKELTVRLLLERPGSGIREGTTEMVQQGVPVKIVPRSGEEVVPVELSFVPDQPGEFRMTLEVVPVEGEILKSNNELTTYITVLKGGLNVAYFDRLRPEVKPIRQVTESPDIQLDYREIRIGPRFPPPRLDAEWFQPGKYDVYIIGDLPASVFDQPQHAVAPLQAIRDAVDRGAGLLMIGGFRSFGPGGYADTPLAAVLPVRLRSSDAQAGDTADPALHVNEPLPIVPTTAGVQHFVMRLDAPEKNADRWKQLPPLQGGNRFTDAALKPLAQVLARSPQGAPLLVAQDVGQGRSMAFAGDTTYQWALAGHRDASQQFWRQVILWLAHKELQGDTPVWLKLSDRRIRRGQGLDILAGARTAEGLPVDDAEITLTIKGPDGATRTLSTERLEREHAARFVETSLPGEYAVTAHAQRREASIGPDALARFVVYEQDIELQNPAADLGLARELAEATQGESVPPEQLRNLLQKLLREDLAGSFEQVTRHLLWDNSYLLLLFAGIMTMEWFYRKKRGLV